MDKIVIISYSQSPLQCLMPYFKRREDFHVLDEKFTDFSQLQNLKPKELWLDTYIDLYDEKLTNPDYLYHFFSRIHKICDDTSLISKRILRNYSYKSNFEKLNKIFYLYYSFTNFFTQAYNVLPIYIPDLLDKDYKFHPYTRMLMGTDSLLWDKTSLFRVIYKSDVITNLTQNILLKEAVVIQGMKVSLADLMAKIEQIFGKKDLFLDNAYHITVEDSLEGQILTEINYNLESICINHLS